MCEFKLLKKCFPMQMFTGIHFKVGMAYETNYGKTVMCKTVYLQATVTPSIECREKSHNTSETATFHYVWIKKN